MPRKYRYMDYYILVPFLALLGIGIVMVYSASAYYVKTRFGASETSYLVKQAIFAFVGLFLAFIAFHLKLDAFRNKKLQGFVMIAFIVALLGLVVLGRLGSIQATNGASSWYSIGPFSFQPSEFAKLAIVFFLAYMFTGKQKSIEHPDFRTRDLFHGMGLVVGIIILTLVQPDTGGAMIMASIAFVMLFASGVPFRQGASLTALGLAGGAGLYYVFGMIHLPEWLLKKFYQLRRIAVSLHPFESRQAGGIQVVNSVLAINHGGLFGVGLGMSTQKLGYLPEPYTDFILAIIAEELGLIGGLAVVLMIFTIVGRAFFLAVHMKDTFRSLIAIGLGTMILVQTFFNVGAVLGLIPVTGVTLPFISYGGSSLLSLSIAVGVLLNIGAGYKKSLAVSDGSKGGR